MSGQNSRSLFTFFHVLCFFVALSGSLAARQLGSQSIPTGSNGGGIPADNLKQKDGRYRIGPGDIIEIRTIAGGKFVPELSRDSVRIDNSGMIHVPMFSDVEVQASCLTEGELAGKIRSMYLKYKRDPYVDVFIKEYRSRIAAVTGAVSKPGQFQLQRDIRLAELVNLWAGGPSERAGSRLQVIRTPNTDLCSAQPGEVTEPDVANLIVTYELGKTLKGEPDSNPFVQAGDVIVIQEAPEAYVIGNVLNPTIVQLKETITITRAIAMAGGTMPDTKDNKVRIVRQLPGSMSKIEIFVDLKAIDKQKAEDIALLPGDIVDVPTSGGKRFLRSLVGTIAPTVGQLPVRVVR
jgi:polysaccharide biosynthesis/export protein